MPSSLGAGPAVRTRLKSRLVSGLIGYASPEFTVETNKLTAPGAVGEFLFVAPRACKIVRIDHVNTTVGGGATKINVRKHLAGQTVAANTATGANVLDVVTAGLAADATANASQLNTLPPLTTPVGTPPAAPNTFAAGDKLAVIYPAAWIGMVTIYFVWL